MADERLTQIELEVLKLRWRVATFEKLFGKYCAIAIRELGKLKLSSSVQVLTQAVDEAHTDERTRIQKAQLPDEQKALQLRAVDEAAEELRQSFAYFSFDEPE